MVDIRRFQLADLDEVVAFSIRAWQPVFASVRTVLGDRIFLHLHPDWASGQAEAVRNSCTTGDLDVFVAVVADRPVAFVGVALNAYHQNMGAVEIMAVDPDHQRRGIASALINHAVKYMREQGMNIAVVETGGDPGHAPARAAYESTGFTLLPVARYFQLLQVASKAS
jgi:GNAT superfamily N-acetyltransferase